MAIQPPSDFYALQAACAGRYSLIRELGRGGMGVVYLAQEIHLDRPVALKVLPSEYALRVDLRDRFLREARTAARLSHPNIVPIHAVHEIGDHVFYAMSYIEGETLGERIRARGPLPPKDAARILREVGWALAYAHAQGVVHRDVKPDNILLEASSGRAVVTDFGIAHVVEAADDNTARHLVGTAEFVSPEQVDRDTVDGRSDLYALGVVGYYMLSGRLPFQGATPSDTLVMHLTHSPTPLSRVVPGLPARLAHAIDRCLSRDPEHRFADGEALTQALSQALDERRELPAALRLFLKQNRESTLSMVVTELFLICLISVWLSLFAFGIMELEWIPLLAPLTVWLALGSAPIASLVLMARRLLRAGYQHADVLRALREQLDERDATIEPAAQTRESRIDRWLNRLVGGGLATQVGALSWLAFGPYIAGSGDILAGIIGASCATWVIAGSATAVRHQQRERKPGKGWLKFWDSAIGRAIFKASRIGVDEPPSVAPYGHTELAIGVAADKLFDALPTAHRAALRELPDVVRRLEDDAERLRSRIKGLDALIHDGGDRAAESLLHQRTEAETRMRDVVAALESIRIQLLKLHASSSHTIGVTIDVAAARDVSSDVARLLEGRRDVERLLGRRIASELTPSPTPV